ncbi:3'-5' exonuclease domain - like 5 [Theobroma cacao]|nr:3'-5' exonuclease domain - like 5 [Theobroma cacao]
MLDGTFAVTELITERERRGHCLDILLQKMCENGNMVLGFDIEWLSQHSNDSLLTLCNQFGCLLITLGTGRPNFISKPGQFLSHKDIIVAGVHLQGDVKKLWEKHRLEIRNVVDLSELAADVLHQPRLRAFGVRSLAHQLLLVPFKARPPSMIRIDNSKTGDVPQKLIECASTEAHAAYKIGKKLGRLSLRYG